MIFSKTGKTNFEPLLVVNKGYSITSLDYMDNIYKNIKIWTTCISKYNACMKNTSAKLQTMTKKD